MEPRDNAKPPPRPGTPAGDGESVEEGRELDYEVLLDDAGMRLDLFLHDRMVWRSRSSIQKLIEEGKVRYKTAEGGGKAVDAKPSRRVKDGEIYAVTIPKPMRELELLAKQPDLEILWPCQAEGSAQRIDHANDATLRRPEYVVERPLEGLNLYRSEGLRHFLLEKRRRSGRLLERRGEHRDKYPWW